jgi:hypothetical protein
LVQAFAQASTDLRNDVRIAFMQKVYGMMPSAQRPMLHREKPVRAERGEKIKTPHNCDSAKITKRRSRHGRLSG